MRHAYVVCTVHGEYEYMGAKHKALMVLPLDVMASKHLSEVKLTVLHSRMPIFVVLISLATLLSILVTYSHPDVSSAHSLEHSQQHVPVNAVKIIARCMSLKASSGPPPAFNSRDISDRYEPGTNATWIKNGVIFTGEKNGTVIVKGDLLLDKGIVKAIGRIPGWMLDQVDNLTTVNAHGAWITPGLGKTSRS